MDGYERAGKRQKRVRVCVREQSVEHHITAVTPPFPPQLCPHLVASSLKVSSFISNPIRSPPGRNSITI